MWVHHNTDIDFYDLTSSAGLGPDGNPVLAFSQPSGSTCSQAMTFAMGDHLITYHGGKHKSYSFGMYLEHAQAFGMHGSYVAFRKRLLDP